MNSENLSIIRNKCTIISILILIIIFYGKVEAQDSIRTHFSNLLSNYNCTKTPGHPFKMISEGALRTMLRRDFSLLVLNRDQSASTAGTGITMDFNTDKTVVNYNLAWLTGKQKKVGLQEMPRAKGIFSVSVQAGFSNSIGTIFSDTKANGKAAATLKYSHFISFLSGPATNEDYCNRVLPVTRSYIAALIAKGDLERYKLLNSQSQIQALYQQISVVDAQILDSNLHTNSATSQNIVNNIALLEQKKILEESVAAINKQSLGDVYQYNILQKLLDSLSSFELANIKWNKQTISWLDFQLTSNVGAYNIFDDVSKYTNQDTTLTQLGWGTAINQIQNWKKALFYWKLGYRNTASSNLDGATSYTLSEHQTFNSGSSEKKLGKSIDAFKLSEAGSLETFRKGIIEGDAILMFAHNTFGIHGFFDLSYNFHTEMYTKTGVFNGGLGLIFTVFDYGKDKAKINIEPFFKLKDINSQTKLSENLSTWERYTFGVRVGLPFNKVLL